jgi:hypothetical protein
MQQKRLFLALLAGVAMSGAAQAALHDRGGGLIYDDVLNITWLADANLAASNTFGLAYNTNLGDHPDDSWGAKYTEQIYTNGKMTWGAALHWIDAINAANYLGYDDWRLPTALNQNGTGPCYGYNCTSSEMGHLYYFDSGLSAGQTILVSTTLDDYFTNMQPTVYWSGTEYAPSKNIAWVFGGGDGSQANLGKNGGAYVFGGAYAWAVRPGDVAAVPEADTWAMLLAGLGLLGVATRRRRG